MTDEDRENRKTDPVPAEPPSSPHPAMNPPPPRDSYTDGVVLELLATAKRLESHYSALLSPDGLLEGQTRTIAGLIDTNHKLVLHQFDVLTTSIKDLTIRADGADDRLDDGAKHFARLDGEVISMRADMAVMTARVTELENELKALRNAATSPPQPTG